MKRRGSKSTIAHERDVNDPSLSIVRSDGEVIHRAPASVTSAVRYFVARVQLNDPAGLPRRLALTSSTRGEGVTFLTRTLGAVIAHDLRRRVCIVDLNWWDKQPPGPTNHGISDVLNDNVLLDDALVRTTDDNLCLLPAGETTVSTRPVIAKDPNLGRVLDRLGSDFDHLLLELPAVTVSSDALTMARLSDAYAFVVRQGVTTQGQARAAIEELSGVVSLGIVLNRVTSKVPRPLRRWLSA
jgi:Mrp family chromosome partitioning ATPase